MTAPSNIHTLATEWGAMAEKSETPLHAKVEWENGSYTVPLAALIEDVEGNLPRSPCTVSVGKRRFRYEPERERKSDPVDRLAALVERQTEQLGEMGGLVVRLAGNAVEQQSAFMEASRAVIESANELNAVHLGRTADLAERFADYAYHGRMAEHGVADEADQEGRSMLKMALGAVARELFGDLMSGKLMGDAEQGNAAFFTADERKRFREWVREHDGLQALALAIEEMSESAGIDEWRALFEQHKDALSRHHDAVKAFMIKNPDIARKVVALMAQGA